MKKKPYCLIIDSGLGGLHILAQSRKLCPKTNFLYIADDLNLPYGNKTSFDIYNSIRSIYKRFKSCYDISCIVLACNTATACAINNLRKEIPIPIIGTEPNIKTPTGLNYKNIAVLATPLTIQTMRYKNLLNKQTISIECDSLAKDIEDANLTNSIIDISQIVDKLKAIKADSIVLGCTHYNFIIDQLKCLNLPIFDSVMGVAKQIRIITNHLSSSIGNTVILTTSGNKIIQNSYIKYYSKLILQ